MTGQMSVVGQDDLPLQRVYQWERERAAQVFLTQPYGGGKVREWTWAEAVGEARRVAPSSKPQLGAPRRRLRPTSIRALCRRRRAASGTPARPARAPTGKRVAAEDRPGRLPTFARSFLLRFILPMGKISSAHPACQSGGAPRGNGEERKRCRNPALESVCRPAPGSRHQTRGGAENRGTVIP